MKRPTYQGVRRLEPAQIRRLRRRSLAGGLRDARRFTALERFVLFIGYARSGHTVLASILDAHPDAVIANELDALGFLEHGFGRRELLHMVATNARETHEHGNEWTGYSYRIPGGWQGRVRTPRVMGDKKAGVTTRRLAAHPELLEQLRSTLGVPLRIVHVTRNPWDLAVARKRHNAGSTMADMLRSLGALFDGIEVVEAHTSPDERLRVRAEDLIAEPDATLRRVLAFLNLEAEDEFVDAAGSILFASPKRRRDDHAWTQDEHASLEERVSRHAFLGDYAFDD